MAQITWRNIAAPNFSSANQLLTTGQQQITGGLDQVADVATGLAEEQKTDKTQDLVQQLMKASSEEELNNINTDIEGVDPEQVTSALYATQKDLRDRAQQAEATNLSKQKFQFEKDKYEESQNAWGDTKTVDLGNKIIAVQYNGLGESRIVDEHQIGSRPSKATKPSIQEVKYQEEQTVNNTIIDLAEQVGIQKVQLGNSEVRYDADYQSYAGNVADVLAKKGIPMTPEIQAKIKSHWEPLKSGLPRELRSINTAQENLISESEREFNNSNIDFNNKVEGMLGFSVEEIADRDSPLSVIDDTFVDAAEKLGVGSDTSWFTEDPTELKAALVAAREVVPDITAKQFIAVMDRALTTNSSIRDETGAWNVSGIKTAAEDLKTYKSSKELMSALDDWTTVRDRNKADFDSKSQTARDLMLGDLIAYNKGLSFKKPEPTKIQYNSVPNDAALILAKKLADNRVNTVTSTKGNNNSTPITRGGYRYWAN